MSFQQALSGLNGASTALETVSNNIANSGTVGFKQSVTQFADLYANSMSGSGQVGMGASVADVNQQFTQGNLTSTNNPLDLAINGSGMFPMTSDSQTYTYTRNGQFRMDAVGNIVDASGLKLCGYAANATGTITPSDPPVPLSVQSTIAFKQTATSSATLNLSSTAAQPSAMTRGAAWPATVTTPPPTLSSHLTVPANEQLKLSLDGQPIAGSFTVNLRAKTYLNVYDLATGVQTDINNALLQQGTSSAVDVTYNSGGYLQIQSRGLGADSGLPVAVTGSGAARLFGTGGSAATHGSAWPSGVATTPATASLTVNGTNNALSLAVDGQTAVPVTLTSTIYANNTLMAAGVQNDINTALAAAGTGTSVTVSYNAGGYFEILSDGVGTSSGILTPPSGTAAANLFGVGGTASANGTAGLVGLAGAVGADNFSPTDPSSYTSTTSETVFDSSGNSHTVNMYFAKTAVPNQWKTYLAIDGQAANINGNYPVGGATYSPTIMSFNATGQLTLMTPPAGGTPPNGYAQIQLSNGNSSTPATVDLVLDLSKATQNSLNFGVTSISQNGYAAGILSGVTVDKNGIIQAAYTNGQQQAMGQLALVGFSAPNALQSVGNNQWSATTAAGKQPSFAPGQGGLGVVQSGAVEESNVDLTKELVNMITQQRAYQANAQSIKTQDQIMQTIVNLR